jgi:hypothetical protein
MTPDYEPARVQFSAENAELERLRIRSERMELIAQALETLAQSRELLIKADEALARSWPYRLVSRDFSDWFVWSRPATQRQWP